MTEARPRRTVLSVALMLIATLSLILGGSVLASRTHDAQLRVTPTSTSTSTHALLGMSAPSGLWAQRVKDVGPGLQARRIFVGSLTGSLSLASTACGAGMTPVISFKESPFTWAQIGAGAADATLRSLATKLNALPCPVFVTIHHEPSSDGTAADFSKMAAHAYPILGGPAGVDPKVKVGVIGNGWWFNSNSQGLSDAQLATWVTPAVLAASDFVAADTYQGTASAEGVASKITRMGAWARRVGTPAAPVRALGLGEFNMQTPQGMTDALAALKSDPLFAFGCIWNMDGTGSAHAHVLTGAMLAAFKSGLSGWMK